ncbi:MAG: hypothetical protein FWE82_06560, partial [Defluviitaleaceae bacterium]|nr:hypothetical protein [Defluviitaleaceae bacterium]
MSEAKKILFGIDGYIDEVWQIVESRSSRADYKLYGGMKVFAENLAAVGSGGFSNEIVRKRRTYGGFTANTGKAAGRLGIETSMIGMFGVNRIDSVFAEFASGGKLLSVGEPGISQIYEFPDGKLMLPYVQEIMGFNWDALLKAADKKILAEMFGGADLIAVGYWSLLPAFDEIVKNICEVFLLGAKNKRMFFDFADIRKREREALENTLRLLAE